MQLGMTWLRASRSAALVLIGNFNSPDVNWAYHTADTNKSRKFLKHVEGNFLIQVLRELTRNGGLLVLLFVNRDGLMGDVMIGGCLGHSDHEMVEFKVFGNMRKTVSRATNLSLEEQTSGHSRN